MNSERRTYTIRSREVWFYQGFDHKGNWLIVGRLTFGDRDAALKAAVEWMRHNNWKTNGR